MVFNSIDSCCLGASPAKVLYRLSTRHECVICRANGTDKSSEASMPFLMARLIRHWSPQMLQLRDCCIEVNGVKFQALGVKLS